MSLFLSYVVFFLGLFVYLIAVMQEHVSHGGPPPRKWSGPIYGATISEKHSPRTAEIGENLPVETLRCLSEWCSVLEDRGTVPGTSLGGIIGCISAFEDSLSGEIWFFPLRCKFG